jgi:hypothetical protein
VLLWLLIFNGSYYSNQTWIDVKLKQIISLSRYLLIRPNLRVRSPVPSFWSANSKTETCRRYLPSRSPSRTTTRTPLRTATPTCPNTLRASSSAKFSRPSTRGWPWCRPATPFPSCSTPGRCQSGRRAHLKMYLPQSLDAYWECKSKCLAHKSHWFNKLRETSYFSLILLCVWYKNRMNFKHLGPCKQAKNSSMKKCYCRNDGNVYCTNYQSKLNLFNS